MNKGVIERRMYVRFLIFPYISVIKLMPRLDLHIFVPQDIRRSIHGSFLCLDVKSMNVRMI